MASKDDNRRRFLNTWLQPKVQLWYGMLGFVFVAVAVLATQVLGFLSLRGQAIRVLEEAGEGAGLVEAVDLAMRSALLQGLWIYVVVAASALFLTAAVLHRFIGPQVPIRRMVRSLVDGEYGTTCRIRDKDEMHELVEDLNELSRTLQQRHAASESESRTTRREAGFSIVEVLVILVVISIVTAIGVSQFLRAYDRSRQRSTMADMRTVASASGTYYIDAGEYSSDLESLEPYYLQPVPRVDRWGYAWQYASADSTYELVSRGSDGVAGPPAPTPWSGDPFECDLVLTSGTFSQAPDL